MAELLVVFLSVSIAAGAYFSIIAFYSPDVIRPHGHKVLITGILIGVTQSVIWIRATRKKKSN